MPARFDYYEQVKPGELSLEQLTGLWIDWLKDYSPDLIKLGNAVLAGVFPAETIPVETPGRKGEVIRRVARSLLTVEIYSSIASYAPRLNDFERIARVLIYYKGELFGRVTYCHNTGELHLPGSFSDNFIIPSLPWVKFLAVIMTDVDRIVKETERIEEVKKRDELEVALKIKPAA